MKIKPYCDKARQNTPTATKPCCSIKTFFWRACPWIPAPLQSGIPDTPEISMSACWHEQLEYVTLKPTIYKPLKVQCTRLLWFIFAWLWWNFIPNFTLILKPFSTDHSVLCKIDSFLMMKITNFSLNIKHMHNRSVACYVQYFSQSDITYISTY